MIKFNKNHIVLIFLFIILFFNFDIFAQLIDLDSSELKMNISEIKTKEKFIGRGSYKEVFKYWFNDNNVIVAFFFDNDRGALGFERELKFYQTFQHKNLIKAYAYSRTEKFIILEYAEMDLQKYVRDRKPSLKDKIIYFLDIAHGLKYLHDNRIIHRDLKPKNVVLVWNEDQFRLIAKLIDFDFCIKLPDDSDFLIEPASRGSIGYKAPELLKPFALKTIRYGDTFRRIPQFKYFLATDINALGSLFYYVLFSSNFYEQVIKYLDKNVEKIDINRIKSSVENPINIVDNDEVKKIKEDRKYRNMVESKLIYNNYENILEYIFKADPMDIKSLKSLSSFERKEEIARNQLVGLIMQSLDKDVLIRPSIDFIIKKLESILLMFEN